MAVEKSNSSQFPSTQYALQTAIAANVALQHGDNKTFGKLTASPRNAGPFMKGAQMIASARALAKQGVPMS
jgi:hypothetical protein